MLYDALMSTLAFLPFATVLVVIGISIALQVNEYTIAKFEIVHRNDFGYAVYVQQMPFGPWLAVDRYGCVGLPKEEILTASEREGYWMSSFEEAHARMEGFNSTEYLMQVTRG